MSIDNNRDGWAQTVLLAQTLFETGIQFVQIIDHLPNSIALY
jgi:hypothetical protein